MSFIYDLQAFWTDINTTYEGIQINVSNGASGAPVANVNSRLLNLKNNGSSVLSVDKSGNIYANSLTASTYIGNVRNAINVMAPPFNVLKDGSDQSVNIQLALNAGKAYNAAVYIPGSPSPASVPIVCKALTLPSQVMVFGDGNYNSILRLPNGANTYILASESYVNNYTFADVGDSVYSIGFDGNKANNTGSTVALLIIRAYRAVIDSCRFNASYSRGLALSELSANGTSLSATGMAGCRFINNSFDICRGAGFVAINGAFNRIADFIIAFSDCNNCGTDGVDYPFEIGRGAGAHIINNQIYAGTLGTIRIFNFGAGLIVGNVLDNTLGGDYSIDIDAGGAFNDFVISNNQLSNGRVAPSTPIYFIRTNKSAAPYTDAIIANNAFSYVTAVANIGSILPIGYSDRELTIGPNAYYPPSIYPSNTQFKRVAAIGETDVIIKDAGGVGLTSTIITNAMSQDVGPGTYKVGANIFFNIAGGTTIQALTVSISTVSGTMNFGPMCFNATNYPAAYAPTGDPSLTVSQATITLNAAGTIYVVVRATFAVGTLASYGSMSIQAVQ